MTERDRNLSTAYSALCIAACSKKHFAQGTTLEGKSQSSYIVKVTVTSKNTAATKYNCVQNAISSRIQHYEYSLLPHITTKCSRPQLLPSQSVASSSATVAMHMHWWQACEASSLLELTSENTHKPQSSLPTTQPNMHGFLLQMDWSLSDRVFTNFGEKKFHEFSRFSRPSKQIFPDNYKV